MKIINYLYAYTSNNIFRTTDISDSILRVSKYNSGEEQINRLFSSNASDTIKADIVLNNILINYSLWYFADSFHCLEIDQNTIIDIIKYVYEIAEKNEYYINAMNVYNRIKIEEKNGHFSNLDDKDLKSLYTKYGNISFKGIADKLYYDYKGAKHVNIYKLRILEELVKNNFKDTPHAKLEVTYDKSLNLINVDFKLSEVAESLTDFCEKAEVSRSASYNRCISILYETLGLKKDDFDRLNNETEYLDTMNNTDNSTKKQIPYFVPKNSKYILDVGPGGGAMIEDLAK